MSRVEKRRRQRVWARFGLAVVVALAGGAVGGTGAPASADACGSNPVVCENKLTGNPPSEWDIDGAGEETIQGFATDISVNVGQRVDFKINTDARAYSIDIYRLGYYNGSGARKIASTTPSVPLPQHQNPCVDDSNGTGNYDCGGWAVSASWTVPAGAVSGVYIAKLTRSDNGDSSHITFVVRDDASHSQMFFKTSDATWQAYNMYGGTDFYPGGLGPDNGRAYKISYNRPFATRKDNDGRDFLFSNEYPMIRFLEQNGYDVSYTTDVDTDRRGQLITNHRAFLSVGHDEYWSGPQRGYVEAARDAGVNLAFFSGNEVYWKTRWENSVDGHGTPYRTLVCYKETWGDAKIDQTSSTWTGTWRDPRFSPPSDGGRPENALTGTQYMSNNTDLAIQVSAEQGRYRLWRNTGAADLLPGQVATLAPHTVGYESDEDVDNGFRPAGLIQLSSTTGPTPEYLRDFGRATSPGTTTHHLTLYRASSGALVFGAGTIQWSWGLDSNHDGIRSPANHDMRQATMNLFTDMGVLPGVVPSGLSTAAAPDTQAPVSTITSPPAGTTVANGSLVTAQGTATDTGGRVAAVEASTDGGNTWHRATGTTSWSYTFAATGAGAVTVRVRAVDDNANLESAPATRSLALTGATSLFGNRVPATPAADDNGPVTLGVRFTAQADGYVTGVRFYKGAGNTGTHTGTLWTASGTPLATGTFANETATGWQTLTFTAPVAVSGGSTYLASYFAPTGHYAADPFFFSYTDYVAQPLVAPRTGGNGTYAGGDNFPTQSYQATNYYVDVSFVDLVNAPPTAVTVNPAANTAGVAAAVHPSVKFSKALNPASIQFTLKNSANVSVAGTTGYDSASKTATFTPSAALANGQRYTASVQAADPQGHVMEAPAAWSFSTDPYPTMSRLFAANATPAVAAEPDGAAVTLGVKFVPATTGTVVGVRFYQGSGNTGTHTGSLWTTSGTLLARATFAGETGTGWQTVTFATPVAVNAGTTYVAAYYAPAGHYASNGGYFSSPRTNGPLSAPAGANGVYQYGSDAFPNRSYQSTNYWVDPIFSPGTGTPADPPPGPSAGEVSLFTDADLPAAANWNDPDPIEVGVKFTAETDGVITGVRFYKGAQNVGVHAGSLWTVAGDRLASATFTGETESGWQEVRFAQPVPITGGTTYVASYSTTVGFYAADINALATAGIDRPPLHVPAFGGVYRYGAGFPDSAVRHNYWVDVVFKPATG
jgi:hypothetical protein